MDWTKQSSNILLCVLLTGCFMEAILGGRTTLFAQSPIAQKFENFNVDPLWDNRNNITPVSPVSVTQDFGFSPTNFAQGQSTGEVGGKFWRSLTPAFYGKVIDSLTLEDSLTASGQFVVTQADGASGVLVGWFNDSTMGWRPPSWMGFRLDDGRKILVEYNTQTNQAGGNRIPGDPTLNNTTAYDWTFAYNPAGGVNLGSMHFTVDGPEFNEPVEFNHTLDLGHKAAGANFNRFGFINLQRPGSHLDVYFDDLAINGQPENFDIEPGWDGQGNRITFDDFGLPGANRFGYSDTNVSGGQATGEMGGRAWRTLENRPDLSGYYGDDIGTLTLENRLFASGKLTMTEGAPDSGMLFGWYNSEQRGWPTENFLGVVIEGPSRVGHYFRPYSGTSQQGVFQDSSDGPVIRPDQVEHTWTMEYLPTSNGGNGTIEVTLDGLSKTLFLPAEHKEIGAIFDRFGIATLDISGAQTSIFFDDVEYTTSIVQPPITRVEWANDTSGNAASDGSWSPGNVPNSNETTAVLGGAITTSRTVFADTDIVTKGLEFDNVNSYVLAGQGVLHLEADSGNASIDVLRGSHELRIEVSLGSDLDVTVPGGSTLNIDDLLDLNGFTLNKLGVGELLINNRLILDGGMINDPGGTVIGAVPEPSTSLLAGLVILAFASLRKRSVACVLVH
jgi:hypothetical protein